MLGHELDAVQQKEWRMFPGLARLSDDMGFKVFVLLHIPLLAGLNWALFVASVETAAITKIWFCVFSILHVSAHILFRSHPENRFTAPLSHFLIWGSGAFGAAYLILTSL